MLLKVSRPLAFLALIILLVSLACGPTVAPTQAPAPPPQQPQQTELPAPPPTEPPAPTPTEPPAPTPTDPPSPTPTEAPSPFAKLEFDGGLEDWTSFIIKGYSLADEGKSKVSVDNGYLTFSLEDMGLFTYLIYDKFTYSDVRLVVRAENRGANNNNVTLICRYSEDGWYEFNIWSNGWYDIYAATPNPKGSGAPVYNPIADGGSNKIKMGKDVNEYAITCKGDILSLTINGFDTKTIADRKYGLRSGKIGIAVSSFNVPNVKVDIDWLDITEP